MPVEEVFAESALLDRVFERSIGRAHDPDICPAFLRLAEPFVGLVVKESEQPGLSIRGEVADLVEKECPTFGLFHLADSVCHGAGKGALAVTEQGARHQVAGEHRTVNRHERPVRELALGLNPAGQDVLAGAALATKHDDRVGCRGAAHRLEESPEDRPIGLEAGLALGLFDPLLQFSDLPLEFRLGDHAASGVPDLGWREGLRQVVNRASFIASTADSNEAKAVMTMTPISGWRRRISGSSASPASLPSQRSRKTTSNRPRSMASRAPADVPTPIARPPSASRQSRIDCRTPGSSSMINADQILPPPHSVSVKPRVPDRPINGIHSPATRSAVARA